MRLRRVHRFLGLVTCVPALLWGLSGALLSWKNWARDAEPAPSTNRAVERRFRVELGQALAAAEASATNDLLRIEWRHLAGEPYYVIHYADGRGTALISGETGRRMFRIDEALAIRIAAEEAPAGVTARGCTLQKQPSLIYLSGMELPVYRVALSDASDVYVSPTTGEAYFRAGGTARLIRFAFYRLHVWKWSSGEGPYRSYLVLGAMALVLTLSSLSGIWLWLSSLRRAVQRASA